MDERHSNDQQLRELILLVKDIQNTVALNAQGNEHFHQQTSTTLDRLNSDVHKLKQLVQEGNGGGAIPPLTAKTASIADRLEAIHDWHNKHEEVDARAFREITDSLNSIKLRAAWYAGGVAALVTVIGLAAKLLDFIK